MHMRHRAHFGLLALRTVDVVIDGQKVFRRQRIDPLHQQWFAARGFKGWAGKQTVVTP